MNTFITTRRMPLVALLWLSATAAGQDASIHVRADRVTHRVTPYMTGACIEDVNHEIYGGIYSQMIFGESFQEPPFPAVPNGFTAYGGEWRAKDGELRAAGGDGPKLISNHPPLGTGEVSVQVKFRDARPGNAGLIVKVNEPRVGNNHFFGYEISLDPQRQVLILGRHRDNWEHIQDASCKIPLEQWVDLTVGMPSDKTLEVRVDGQAVLRYDDNDHPLRAGAVGLRTWQREAMFRNLSVRSGHHTDALRFKLPEPTWSDGVSAMWGGVRRGTAAGSFSIETQDPYIGTQSQRITYAGGEGELGIENRSLNRWGMNFAAGKPYQGYLRLRAERPAELHLALESADGSRVYAESRIAVESAGWKRYDFALTPLEDDEAGRFALKLKRPGSIVVGHAFLQPGEWGRFKGQPVRKDIAEGLLDQGLTVMRLGGLMANAEEYRWKKMIGPRDRRPPYKGFWYPYSTNGWGIMEFLNFCEAAGFLAIPDLNMDETPQDMIDFVEYVNGPSDSEWGRRRAADGHPEPYQLKYIQLGNEEAVDQVYWQKFKPLAEAIWKKDPQITVIVGDFEYRQLIADPYKFEGAPKIRSLAAHKKILDLAKANERTVWFDVHIWNHDPRDPEAPVAALGSLVENLEKLSPGSDFQICVLEENATNHAVRRAISHARTINGLMRMGNRVRIVCAANALQPYRQNDNGWDQGLLFFSPSQVWGQPPYYVTQMVAKNYLPQCVEVEVQSPADALDATALASEHGQSLTIQVVNLEAQALRTQLRIDGLEIQGPRVRVTELSGKLDQTNTPKNPQQIAPQVRDWDPNSEYVFPPYSFTVIRLEAAGGSR